jgi:hypothetical protein
MDEYRKLRLENLLTTRLTEDDTGLLARAKREMAENEADAIRDMKQSELVQALLDGDIPNVGGYDPAEVAIDLVANWGGDETDNDETLVEKIIGYIPTDEEQAE